MTERLPNQPSSDDELIQRQIAEYRERGSTGVINDTTARVIASRWHMGQSSALYSFASTGAINLDALQAEMLANFTDPNATDDDREELDVLGLYLLETGDREPVEGWHKATQWGARPEVGDAE